MRKILIETSRIDKQAEQAAARISTALSMGIPVSIGTNALSAVGELRLKIRDLQRENITLQFLVDNPEFDVDTQLEEDRNHLEEFYANKYSLEALYNRFGYDHFINHYHPEYIIKACKQLCAECRSHRTPIHEIWEYLLASSGFITKEFVEVYGPQESDKGLV